MSSTTGVPAVPRDPRPRLPWWGRDLIITALIVAVPFVQAPGQDFRPASVLAWILALAPVVVLPFRRRWPLPTLAVLIAIFAGSSFTGHLSPGDGLAVAVAMFQVSTRLSRRQAVLVTVITAAAIIVASLPAAGSDVLEPRAFQFVLVVVIAAAIGDANRSRRAYIEAIVERAERAEQTREAETRQRVSEARLQIARDLHDTVAHQIAVISLNAGAATAALEAQPELAKASLATIRDASRAVLAEIGALLTVLRSDEGAVTPPQPTLERLDELVDGFRAVGLDATQRVEGDLASVPSTTSTVAYRVVQEALTNAHKHGADGRAHVLIEAGPDSLELVVTNHASPAQPAEHGTGFGLIGLQERVASIRGRLDAGPTPGGWRVHAVLPLGGDAA